MPHIKTLFSTQPAVFPLKDGVTRIGRSLDSEIRVALAVVSKQHAVITCAEDGCVLENLSSNHTYVNGKKLLNPARLRHGDRIQVATAVMMYFEDDREDSSDVQSGHTPVRTISSSAPEDSQASLYRTVVPGRLSGHRISTVHQCHIVPEKIRLSVLLNEQSIVTLLSRDTAKPISQALELLNVLKGAHDVEGCDAVAEYLRRCFPPADEAVILLCEGADHSELSAWGVSELQGRDFMVCTDVVHRVASQSECLLISDLWRDSGCEQPELLRMGQISLMCVPIRSASGRCRGVVQIFASNPNPDFEADDAGRLAFLAQMLTMVIGPA